MLPERFEIFYKENYGTVTKCNQNKSLVEET